MVRFITVKKCDDMEFNDGCPYFDRKEIYDYNDECWCKAMGREIPQYLDAQTEDGKYVYMHLAGKFPEWCPLNNEYDIKTFMGE